MLRQCKILVLDEATASVRPHFSPQYCYSLPRRAVETTFFNISDR
jgi:ABC-type bacteriocin/lantibiotic exporter with double-glycine peptidase domain